MLIDDKLLNILPAEAKASPRLRMNNNLHECLEASAQRSLNAVVPGTKFRFIGIRTHRHLNS